MTDKVQKIKDWISKEQDGLMDAQGNFEYPEHEGAYHILCNLYAYIDSLQEEPKPKFKVGDCIRPIDSCLGSQRTICEVCDGWYVTNQGTLDFEYEDNWELVEDSVHRTKAEVDAAMQDVEEKSKAFTDAHKGESAEEILAQMTNQEAIKYLQQLYPNGGHCWLDDQRMEAIGMAINALQEEPVSIWHDASENPKEEEHLMCVYKDNRYHIGKVYKDEFDRLLVSDNKNIIELCMFEKWAYIDDILNFSNVERTVKNWKEPEFKVGDRIKFKGVRNEDVTRVITNIQKGDGGGFRYFFADGSIYSIGDDGIELVEEPVSEELEEAADNALDNVLNTHEIVNVRSCLEMFRFGAKWQKSNLWKPADGDDLPEIDREVIVLIKYNAQCNIHDKEYPTYRVGFGHRPNPDGWDGKNIDTNEVTHYTPKLYDKGGWNAPDIVYWLDVKLPKEIEL